MIAWHDVDAKKPGLGVECSIALKLQTESIRSLFTIDFHETRTLSTDAGLKPLARKNLSDDRRIDAVIAFPVKHNERTSGTLLKPWG